MHSTSADVKGDNRRSSRGLLSYKSLCKPVVLAQAILLVAGCAAFKGYPERASDPASDLLQLKPDIEAKQITACLEVRTNDEKRACRNKIIAARMYAIDILFSEFEESLFRQTRESGFAATVVTLGLTSAAAVAGGTASQILSGTAAFIIGTREAFQKEVLAERTLVAIHTAMRAGRARVAVRLREGLRQSIDDYPFALGLNDLNTYYNAGTILGALVGITETVGAEAQRAEQELQKELSFNLDAAAEKLRDSICGDDPNCGSPDVSKFDEIRACWPPSGVPTDTKMIDFIMQPAFATQRGLVAVCMGL